MRLIELLGRAQTEIRGGLDPRLQLEMALVRAARPEVDHSPDALEERLRRLESGSVPFAPAQAPATHPAQPHDPAQAARAARLAEAVSNAAAPRPASPPAASAPATTPGPSSPPADDHNVAPVADDQDVPPGPDDEAVPPATDDGAPTAGGADRVKRAWALVLQQTEAQNIGLYAALKDARVRADGDRLVVGLPSSLTFGKASTPENRALLTAIITRTTGDAPDLKFELEQAPSEPAAPKAAAPDAGLTIAQRIALAKRELDASDLPDDD